MKGQRTWTEEPLPPRPVGKPNGALVWAGLTIGVLLICAGLGLFGALLYMLLFT